jgi:hypothetical protein
VRTDGISLVFHLFSLSSEVPTQAVYYVSTGYVVVVMYNVGVQPPWKLLLAWRIYCGD